MTYRCHSSNEQDPMENNDTTTIDTNPMMDGKKQRWMLALVLGDASSNQQPLFEDTTTSTTTTRTIPTSNIRIHPIPIPKPQINEALIQIHYAGVCNTDLELVRGYMNYKGVLGHEFVGRVIEVNDETKDHSIEKEWIHQRVCGDINIACTSCEICLPATRKTLPSGTTTSTSQDFTQPENQETFTDHFYNISSSHRFCLARNHCPNRSVLGILNKNGTMAEYITLPIRNLHKVPDPIPDEIAVFAEPIAAAIRILEQHVIRFPFYNAKNHTAERIGSDRIAIVGDGKLGLLIAEVLGREYLVHVQKLLSSLNITDKNNEQPHTWNHGINSMETTTSVNVMDVIAWCIDHRPILIGKYEKKMARIQDYPVHYGHVLTGLVECKLLSECMDVSARNGVSNLYSEKFDVVIDATGSPTGLQLASKLCRPMGTLILKSTCAVGAEFNTANFVINELRVIGSRCGPIDKALEFLSTYSINSTEFMNRCDPSTSGSSISVGSVISRNIAPLHMGKYVTKTFPLLEAVNAISCARDKETMKVLIDCSGSDDPS